MVVIVLGDFVDIIGGGWFSGSILVEAIFLKDLFDH